MASVPKFDRESLGQIVLVLQGGGALGAYHVGVYQALCEAGIEPDWVIGTSIGAINASLIAGNAAEQRLQRLAEFWRRVTHPPLSQLTAMTPLFGQWAAHMATISGGLSNFFTPYPFRFSASCRSARNVPAITQPSRWNALLKSWSIRSG